MAEFKVQTNQLQSYATQIAAMQRELDSVSVRLGAMQLGSILRIRASTALVGRIGDCKWAAAHQSDDLGRLAQGLEEIAQLYETNEKNLSEPNTGNQGGSGSGAGAEVSEDEDMSFWDAILENFPILEVLGLAVEGVGRLVYDLGDVFANWANLAFAGLGSLIDNVEEFAGNLFSGQFLFEFLGEAAVDFGLGFGVSAGITAIIGALGFATPVGWAALGVSAAAAGIVWLGDVICTWITGDDISELIVDGLWAIGEWAGDQIDAFNQQVYEFLDAADAVISDAMDAAGEFVDNAIDAAGEFIDNAGEAIDNAIDAAGEAFNDAVDAAGEFIDNAGEAIDNAFDVVQDGAEALWNGAGEFFNELLPW